MKILNALKTLENEFNTLMARGELVDYHIDIKLNLGLSIHVVVPDDTYSLYSKVKYSANLEDWFCENVAKNTEVSRIVNLDAVYLDALIDEELAGTDFYDYIFEGDRVSGMVRRLGNLAKSNKVDLGIEPKIVTWYNSLDNTILIPSGTSVCIIDCDIYDIESPLTIKGSMDVHDHFATSNGGGLIECITDLKFDKGTLDIREYVYPTPLDKVIYMPTCDLSDMGNAMFGLSRFDEWSPATVGETLLDKVIKQVSKAYNPDLIILNAPTGLNNMVGILASVSDHVICHGMEKGGSTHEALKTCLSATNSTILEHPNDGFNRTKTLNVLTQVLEGKSHEEKE